MKLICAILLLVSLLLSSTFIHISEAAAPGFCDAKCEERCAVAHLRHRCLKYCGICCEECNCVPSGTYGNKDECPCYRDKKNSQGGSKCP